MTEPIGLSPYDIANIIMWICAAIACLGSAMSYMSKVWFFYKQPAKKMHEKIDKMEKRIRDLERAKGSIKTIEESIDITHELLFDILESVDSEKARDAQNRLQNFLIQRGKKS